MADGMIGDVRITDVENLDDEQITALITLATQLREKRGDATLVRMFRNDTSHPEHDFDRYGLVTVHQIHAEIRLFDGGDGWDHEFFVVGLQADYDPQQNTLDMLHQTLITDGGNRVIEMVIDLVHATIIWSIPRWAR